jgi:radical SAM superfamily enzyme YgiQ (UPF0313 family)
MADIVIINPRFEVSFWGKEHAMPILRKRAILPSASLPLLAALTPPEHSVALIDENVEDIDFERCSAADIVAVTGMSVQRFRMKEILSKLKEQGKFTVVGGPWVTVQEDYFDGLADVIFVGEAETTWPQFLQEWPRGSHRFRYEQAERTDMTTCPTPRFDLLKMRRYLTGSLQFSRGCPFECEFCDIIVTFGRRPRIKTSAQIFTELEALIAQGILSCFIVDDNLIGNKKAMKAVLRDVIDWQEKRGYPIAFSTEASIDLADDPEMMELMKRANIGDVFIGIESPNPASLRETKKFQNLRAGGTLLEKIHRIQDAGLEVACGMIIGFDNDDRTIFEAQSQFIRMSRITHVMLGMLHAIPKTPLHARLKAEGRLDPSDTPEFGSNIVPLRMSSQEMRDGYVRLFNELYAPDAYFHRMEDLLLRSRFPRNKFQRQRRFQSAWRRAQMRGLRWFLSPLLFGALMRRIPDPFLRREYRRRIGRFLLSRGGARWLLRYMFNCVVHYHAYTMGRVMASDSGSIRNSF